MRKLYFLLSALLIASVSIAQVSITYKNNGLLAGDSISSKEINFINPGASGSNQIWDFSKLQLSGKSQTNQICLTPAKVLNGVGDYSVLLTENGNENYYNNTENSLEYMGFTTNEIALVYANPIVKMKYPTSFGDHFSDEFSGYAEYNKITPITFSGTYSVNADASGTLVLPHKTLSNVLRITAVRKVLEFNPCSTVELLDTIYYWYAQGVRYPVLTVISKTSKQEAQEAIVTHTAYYNIQQAGITEVTNETSSVINFSEGNDIPVLAYPNPFDESLNFSYFLRKPMNISVELYDISGKLSVSVINNQSQSEGIHTESIDAYINTLTPGVYYLRFTFDDKVKVLKSVKL